MKINEFINKFQVTPAVARVTLPLAALGFTALSVTDIEKFSKNIVSRQDLFNADVGLLIVLGFVIVFEFVWVILSPKSDLVKSVFGWILDKIQLLSRGIFQILYVLPLSFLLKPVINYILKKREEQRVMNGEVFEFVNQGVGRRDDDHYFSRVVDTKDLLIFFQPAAGTPRWRFGIKFSNDPNYFTTDRYNEVFPLFHLTKEENENSLRYNLYLDKKNDNAKIVEKYADTRCSIKVDTNSAHTLIQVYDDKEKMILTKKMPAKRYGQIFAWADGRSTFKIAAVIVEK
jgi:hypothetical protein